MSAIKVGDYELGKLLNEGKTKQIFDLPDHPGLVLLMNKDRISAHNGVRMDDMEGKAMISNQTNAKVFELLNLAGVKTAFVKLASEKAFLARKCEMVPIEWVTRRLATGSFLKRNPGINEGFRFAPPKQETFFKDDANDDPQWSEEQIISAKFNVNNLLIGSDEVDIMRQTTILVFEILEKAWNTRNCALVDMKIEFGVDENGEILVADVIDSDSWRLWPSGDKRLMVDKQVYRNLSQVTSSALETVKRNFQWVSEQLDNIVPKSDHLVVIIMGSASDKEHCQKIAKHCNDLGLNVEMRVSSAHKVTKGTLQIVSEYEGVVNNLVFITVAGRSNGLGPVLSGNTSFPVINCPPVNSNNLNIDLWSSINLPSGLGCATVIYPEAAALNAAQILGITNFMIWSKLRVRMINNLIGFELKSKVDCPSENQNIRKISFKKNMSLKTISSRFYKLEMPKRFKGTIVERWANYWKGLARDYKEVAIDSAKTIRGNRVKSTVYGLSGVFLYSCYKTNPDYRSFNEQLKKSEQMVSLVSPDCQNLVATEYLKLLERSRNNESLRTTSLGFFSIMWIDNNSSNLSTYEAKCDYLKPDYQHFHERIIDIGFWRNWWNLTRKLKDYDVNY
ncbi:CLUMA_CG003275, isoform A [Clunio marinus]|uniref:CLUMA_CG003275, isoform A n=1 Tax=Clunio marinus TaxID=568069 RepID=A0A1J1HQD6_9DIPT|nr:CLUMA_CG003275, isoform A [Clunio marinus]